MGNLRTKGYKTFRRMRKNRSALHAEDDWSTPERQAEDKRGAESKAAQTKHITRNLQSHENHNGLMKNLKNGTGRRRMENGRGGNMRSGAKNERNGERRRQRDHKGEVGTVGKT